MPSLQLAWHLLSLLELIAVPLLLLQLPFLLLLSALTPSQLHFWQQFSFLPQQRPLLLLLLQLQLPFFASASAALAAWWQARASAAVMP